MTNRGCGLTRTLLAALVLASSLQFAPPAQAKTLTVCPDDCDYETIAAALEAARDGDVIDIGEGTYAGGLVVKRKVTLRGAGRDETTIQGPDDTSVVRVGKGVKVAIEEVTIAGGGGSPIGANAIGGGILNEGELTVSDSIVRDNTVATSGARARLGGGIYTDSTKPVRIRGSVIAGNQALGGGGGVFVRSGDVDIVGTTVSGNVGGANGKGHGGGILLEGSETMQIVDCVITDNRAAELGGGVYATAPLRIVGSTLSGNRAFGGGGVASRTGKSLKIEGSVIKENTATLSGGGINILGAGGLDLSGSTVEFNQSRSGGGIATEDGDLSIERSTISANNASDIGGGILNRFDRKIDLDNSQVIVNRAGSLGGGVFGDSRLRRHNGSVVTGNLPDQCVPISCG